MAAVTFALVSERSVVSGALRASGVRVRSVLSGVGVSLDILLHRENLFGGGRREFEKGNDANVEFA
jgi:hypothetical protein